MGVIILPHDDFLKGVIIFCFILPAIHSKYDFLEILRIGCDGRFICSGNHIRIIGNRAAAESTKYQSISIIRRSDMEDMLCSFLMQRL